MQNEKVDIAELDWEDRERVLRLLFSKINTGVIEEDWAWLWQLYLFISNVPLQRASHRVS